MITIENFQKSMDKIFDDAVKNNRNNDSIDLIDLSLEYYSNWIELLKTVDRTAITSQHILVSANFPLIFHAVNLEMKYIDQHNIRMARKNKEFFLKLLGDMYDEVKANAGKRRKE